jgi:hypothetical protein
MALQGEAKTRYMREYMRRRRAGQATAKPKRAPPRQATGEIARTAGPREESGEIGKREWLLMRGENAKLKSDNAKLKAALAEEPDAAKLRKKIIDQQVEMAFMRKAMKEIAKERDKYRVQTEKRFREAKRHANPENYRIIVKALHSDRAKHATAAELAEAERLFIAMRPLFDKAAH